MKEVASVHALWAQKQQQVALISPKQAIYNEFV